MQTALIICGSFYSLLCVFSLVTGLIYLTGHRKLNPLELSEKTMKRLQEGGPEKIDRFTRNMGWVTFIVGIVQGITAFSFFRANMAVFYWIALGFTLFSIASVAYKLIGKINLFPVLKSIAYVAIFVILLLPGSRTLFFGR